MNIFLLELRNLRRSALTGIITISLILYAMLAFFPSMQSEAMQDLAGAKLEGIDPVLLNALGLSEMLDFSVITNYFGYVMQFAALAIMVLATQQAVALLIKEETDGTIEFLCSKPISRDEIFFQKTLTHFAILIFSAVFYALVTIIGYLSFSDYTFGEAARESVIFFSSILK